MKCLKRQSSELSGLRRWPLGCLRIPFAFQHVFNLFSWVEICLQTLEVLGGSRDVSMMPEKKCVLRSAAGRLPSSRPGMGQVQASLSGRFHNRGFIQRGFIFGVHIWGFIWGFVSFSGGFLAPIFMVPGGASADAGGGHGPDAGAAGQALGLPLSLSALGLNGPRVGYGRGTGGVRESVPASQAFHAEVLHDGHGAASGQASRPERDEFSEFDKLESSSVARDMNT